MNKNYIRFETFGKEAYIRRAALEKLKKVDAAIFDCDGVLLDIRESFNRAITETVAYIAEGITGFKFPRNLISKEIIYLFKKSGGYNNDWDLTYAILMFLLHWLRKRTGKELVESLDINVKLGNNVPARFSVIKNTLMKELSRKEFDEALVGLDDSLKSFAEMADASGMASIENALKKSELISDSQAFYAVAKRFLSYPGDVNESILMRVFEEIFCGLQLFKKIYNVEPLFYRGQGLVENEQIILKFRTLDQLALLFGKTNFGISSGRQWNLAKYKLGKLLDKFQSEALVFLDDIQIAKSEALKKGESNINFYKPNPFSLLKSSAGLKPFEFALYIGDSREDVLTVKEANKVKPCFLFAGVYEYSDCKDDAIKSFIEANSEVVVPSVNDLPIILEVVKEELNKRANI
jgi:HAD superfamily phosphatase